jgi:hypothetical protein
MKIGEIENTCAAISSVRAVYGNLDVVHHGKVPAYSLVYAYYTRNRRIFILERYYKNEYVSAN